MFLTPDVWTCILFFLPHQAIFWFSEHLQVSYDLTYFWIYVSKDSMGFCRLRAQSHKTPPLQMPHRLSPVLLTNLLSVRHSQPPMLFHFHHLLEWLTELNETVYILDYQLLTKGHNSGTAIWNRCIGQSTWEKGTELMPSLSMPPSSTAICIPPWRSQNPFFRILERFHNIGTIN